MQRIQKNIDANKKYETADKYAKELQNVAKDTNWFETKNKFENAYRIKNQQSKTIEELETARRELVISRRAMLKELYDSEAKQINDELASKGLRIMKDRE